MWFAGLADLGGGAACLVWGDRLKGLKEIG